LRAGPAVCGEVENASLRVENTMLSTLYGSRRLNEPLRPQGVNTEAG
jgi:hypothetical protein